MEWSKAKTIFIILFVILNVFLLVSILYSGTSTSFNSDYVKYVKTLLESRNIRIESDVPTYRSDTGKIVYEQTEIDMSRMVEFLFGQPVNPVNQPESPITLWWRDDKLLEAGNNSIRFSDGSPNKELDTGSREDVLDELGRYFTGLGINQKDYVVDTYNKQDNLIHVRYLKKYRGKLLFDVYADFTVSYAGVESISIIPKDAIDTILPEEIISAYQLMALGAVPNNSIIMEISFGYKTLMAGELNDRPVWRMRFSDGHDEFFSAYTGARVVDNQE